MAMSQEVSQEVLRRMLVNHLTSLLVAEAAVTCKTLDAGCAHLDRIAGVNLVHSGFYQMVIVSASGRLLRFFRPCCNKETLAEGPGDRGRARRA
jgi:hypothetical protein